MTEKETAVAEVLRQIKSRREHLKLMQASYKKHRNHTALAEVETGLRWLNHWAKLLEADND